MIKTLINLNKSNHEKMALLEKTKRKENQI